MLHCAVVFQEDKKPAQSDRVPYKLLLCGCQATKPHKQMEVSAGRSQEDDVVHMYLFHWESCHQCKLIIHLSIQRMSTQKTLSSTMYDG